MYVDHWMLIVSNFFGARKIDGEAVGKHPMISQLLNGTFNERPPRPTYQSIWNVDLVLNMFRKNGLSNDLSIKDNNYYNPHSYALCFDSSMQEADLAALDLKNKNFFVQRVLFLALHASWNIHDLLISM